MKIIAAIFLLFGTFRLNAINSIEKYSYLVFYRDNDSCIVYGTGFFMKLRDTLYFITSAHLFNSDPKRFSILICDSCGDDGKFIHFNIPKAERRKCIIFGEPDIYIRKVSSELVSSVRSVEGTLAKNYKGFTGQDVEKLVLYGYGSADNAVCDFQRSFPVSRVAEGEFIGYYGRLPFSPAQNRYDSVNYWAKSINGHYADYGDSGAPVFFKIADSLYFGGMCVAVIDL